MSYIQTLFSRFEHSRKWRKSVLNESANFVDKQFAEQSLLFWVVLIPLGISAILGFMALGISLLLGYNEILRLPRMGNFWVSTILYISVLTSIFILYKWISRNFVNLKTQSDENKIRLYLKNRKLINITLELRLGKLRNAFLVSADLSKAILSGSDFSMADLRATKLTNADLQNCDFGATDLRESDLSFANCDGATFELAFLNRSFLKGASFKNSSFVEAQLEGCDLSNADLTGANFSQSNLKGAILTGAKLSGARFVGAELGDNIGLHADLD